MLPEAFPELFCLENWLLGGNWKGYDYSWKEKGEKGDGGDWKKDWSKSGDDWKQARTSLSLEKKLRTGRRRMIGRLAVSVESVASVRSKTTTSGVVERRSTLGTPKLKWRSSSLLDSIGLDAWSSPLFGTSVHRLRTGRIRARTAPIGRTGRRRRVAGEH